MAGSGSAFVPGPYPERDEPRENLFDRLLVAGEYVAGRWLSGRARLERIVGAVAACEAALAGATVDALAQRARTLRP